MPKVDNLAKIADYLNVSVDYLLGRTNTQATTYSVNNINDSSVVQGNGSVFGNASISVASTFENDPNNISSSKEEIGILDLYRSLNIRDRAKFMNFVFEMEDKATKA
ncbi:helix-turn-helix transcriptional regulator [Clostridium sp. MD294]|uniref:helix-turn-helix domain-containing protein n=1 Tax=Clostridium sp. MD294 TaxID=97138 RepID=UPI0012EAC49F|nr:helix-turn-helix transcriptional regulator [Clostridium sp. MD294]NDO45496.1 helix-turn-helix transcriptional regulator [Clostridium sp. MD294]